MRPRSFPAALLAPLLLLAGCEVDYSLRVDNQTGRTLLVEVTQDQLVDDPLTLETAAVPAGETRTLGPYRVTSTDPVRAFIRGAGPSFDAPEKIRLSAGETRLTVEETLMSPVGRVTVER